MSAGAWTYAPLPAAGTDPHTRSFDRPASLPLRLLAFLGFTAFAALQFATLLLHPPALRVLAVAAVATGGGGALSLAGALLRGHPRLLGASALVLCALTLAAGLASVGVPARLLLPTRWSALAREVHRGFDGLAGWLWPYRGGQPWPRLAVLAVVPVAASLAAAICFWPSSRWQGARRVAGLTPLVALFLTGVVNEVAPLWRFQGVVLLALIFAWLSLPTLRAQDVNRAIRWLLACTALALTAAPLLSSYRPWIDYASWDPLPAATTFQWDQTYGPNTWSQSTSTMLEVAEQRPRLLRIATLDRFDGLRFLRSSDPPGEEGLDLPAGRHPSRWFERATITVVGLRSSLLVGAGGTPTEWEWLAPAAPIRARRRDGTSETTSPPPRGARYEVVSYAPEPSPAVLRRAPRRFPLAYLPYAQLQLPAASASALGRPNLVAEAQSPAPTGSVVGPPAPGATPASDPVLARRIEASPYAQAFALARRLAAGARSSYEVAQRVERYLRTDYVYDLDVPRARYPLESFLFATRRGYCQQFSGAMALLLRLDGIPARVAVGFEPGVYDPVGQLWNVRALDAHAWVEVYFAGLGWVTFDPTPAPRAPGGQASSLSRSVVLGLHTEGGAAHPASAGALAPLALRASRSGGWSWWQALTLAAILALTLALAAWWLAGARRLRRAFAGDGSGAVLELRSALARMGCAAAGGVTFEQLLATLGPQLPAPARRYLVRLRDLRFAADDARDGHRPEQRDRVAFRRALARGGGPRRRLRALLALPPGFVRRPRAS